MKLNKGLAGTRKTAILHKKKAVKKYWQIYLIFLLPFVYFVVFKYAPMYGILIAFKDYNIFDGVWQSPWAGLSAFREAFSMDGFYQAFRNTLVLNLLDLLVGFPAPIILAIMLNEINLRWLKKTSQTLLYLPHFFSWVIISGMCLQIFGMSGIVNHVLSVFGVDEIAFLSNKGSWLVIYLLVGVWQGAGWGTIVYLAAMTGINTELYEAACVDGANRFRRLWHITLPGIRPTIVILLILNVGKIAEIGFERPFAMGNVMVNEISDVLSTFVYRVGLQSGQYSLATAVGLFQSVIGIIFIIASNTVSKRLGEEGLY